MTDYTSWPVIGKGTERTCYLNPSDQTRLVKISSLANSKQTRREIRYFQFLIKRGIPFDHIPKFYGSVQGTGFIGLEQEYVRNVDTNGQYGSPPESIHQYLSVPLSRASIRQFLDALNELKIYLLRYNIIPCDLGADNIVVKKTVTGNIRLVLIDGLGGTELIPASNYFRILGNRKILRKWEKFLKKLSVRYPQLNTEPIR